MKALLWPWFTSRASPAVIEAEDRRAPFAEHAAVGVAAVGHVVLVSQVAYVERELGARAERVAQRQVGQGFYRRAWSGMSKG